MSKPKLELKLRNTTPLLVGWYESHKQDRMGIRVTEIKGIWRWWCRAFIAGAMYDMNILSGMNDENIYLIPTGEEVEAISCFVGKILGLGYAGKKGAESSRFKLSIKTDSSLKPIEFRKNKTEYQRIKLLTLKNPVEGINTGYTFTLSVEKVREKYRDAENLALKILVVSLQLSGVGKGGRRGLGSLDIISIDPRDIIVCNNIECFIKHIYEESIKVIEKYQEICEDKNVKQVPNNRLPPLPVVSENVFKLYRVNIRNYQSFIDIHQFFVRTERCQVLYGKKICYDELRKTYNAWFLGLPREQKRTGYTILVEHVVRRPSPIFITYHENNNIFGSGVFVSIFLSGDWPKSLEWKSVLRKTEQNKEKELKKLEESVGKEQPIKTINIDEKKIMEAYETFIKEFKDYLNRKRLTLQEIKWRCEKNG
uniref:Type III-B CRISPR module RAMP protein Cmr1 n=1 Tax=Staphylothermus marinus TaxID=2280 RepID=A0A7C4NN14_STAMA